MDSPRPSSINNSRHLPMLVAVGASAGGLEALQSLFDAYKGNNNVAFVVIQHLSADYRTMMDDLLRRHTSLTVSMAQDNVEVEGKHLYLIPAGATLSLSSTRIRVKKKQSHGLVLPIDMFFQSVSEQWPAKFVAIVLSGTGSDGTQGLQCIKQAGGRIIVQDPEQAGFDGMPRSAIATGHVDFVLTTEKMGHQINQLCKNFALSQLSSLSENLLPISELNARQHLLMQLQTAFGINFSQYKTATIDRRIERRMHLSKCYSLEQYVKHVSDDAQALLALKRELLIPVTHFFRDPSVFACIAEQIVPPLVKSAIQSNEEIRIWVAGCSTGEEAYSLAMLFIEEAEQYDRPLEFKIFATDVCDDFVEQAAMGLFDNSIVDQIGQNRLSRFFEQDKQHYRVNAELRQHIVFAQHNLLTDAPFTNLSLVTCRNTLIYLNQEAQQAALSRLQFGLKLNCCLVLGTSESITAENSVFNVFDERNKIYVKYRTGVPPVIQPDATLLVNAKSNRIARTLNKDGAQKSFSSGLNAMANQSLHEQFVPPSVLTDDKGKILQTYGDMRKYWTVHEGAVTFDITQTLISPLSSISASMISRVQKSNNAESSEAIVVKDGSNAEHLIKIQISPVVFEKKNYFLISYISTDHNLDRTQPLSFKEIDEEGSDRMRLLEIDLKTTRENLQSTIEELETTNEELQATNEELMASNEEMQSANEELQSVNEELNTVNTEYQQKVSILHKTNADLEGMSRAVGIATLFLDSELNITRFTPDAAKYFRVRNSDIGRPVEDIANSIKDTDLKGDFQLTLDTQRMLEKEVSSHKEDKLLLRILPYRVASSAQNGLVVTLFDITALKQSQRLQQVLDALPEHIAVLDQTGMIVMVNQSWQRFAQANGDPELADTGIGTNYLDVCGKDDLGEDAQTAFLGIKSVIEGSQTEFTMTYPCHSPTEERWFVMHVVKVNSEAVAAVVSHFNISSWIRRESEKVV